MIPTLSGSYEYFSDPIKYCPFCAKELEEKDNKIKYIIPVQVIESIGGEDGNRTNN